LVKSRQAIVWFLLVTGTAVVMALTVACGGESETSTNTPTSSGAPSEPAEGTLVVSPESGSIGSQVVISGSACNSPGRPDLVDIVFQQGDPNQGTVGAVGLADVPVIAGGFTVDFTIPDQLEPLQGVGGGPVTSGVYQFVTRPVGCVAEFIVTD
jgi:hypothetical protein